MAQGPTPRSTNTRYYKTNKKNATEEKKTCILYLPEIPWQTDGHQVVEVVEVKVNKEGSTKKSVNL